jgi:hypothetical protein
MKLRSARRFVFDLSPELVFEILKYINPLLHYLVSRHYFHDNVFNIDYDKRLPISLLLSLHNVEVLENFKAVLLSLKFRENLEEQITEFGIRDNVPNTDGFFFFGIRDIVLDI